MATVNDETVINAMDAQGDIDGWTEVNFDALTLNDSSSPTRLYRDGDACGQMIIKSSTDGHWYDDITSLDIEGSGIDGKNKIIIMWLLIFKPSLTFLVDVLIGIYDVTGGQDGSSPDGGRWNMKARMEAADHYGWFPCPIYATQPDETTGTFGNLDLNAILSIELDCNNNTGNDVKLAGMEQCHAISYVGGHSVAVTLAILATESISNDLGVFFENGDAYRTHVNIRLGDASASAATSFSPTNKVIHFDNINSDHLIGFHFINDTGGDTLAFSPKGCFFFWNDGASDIFIGVANVDTWSITGCTFLRGGPIELPADASGFVTNGNVFDSCDAIDVGDAEFKDNVVTNGLSVDIDGDADTTGTQVLLSAVAADASALTFTPNLDPDGNLDNMVFSKGAAAHHAISFGTATPLTMTLRGIDFTGFNASDAQNDSTLHILRTSGTVTINLIGCTGNISFKTAGATVVLVVDPVTTLINVKDNLAVNLQNARVLLEASDGTGDFPFDETVTITRVTTTATAAHTAHGMKNGDIAVIRDADQPEYNGPHAISNVSANAYDYTVSGAPTTPATGTIKSTGGIISGLTDASGNISVSRTFSAATPVAGKVRKSTASPRFKDFTIAGTISTTLGLTINVRMSLDE